MRMQNKQFLIDPWRNQNQEHQNSQNSLRRFQQFINKANLQSFRLKKQTQKLNQHQLPSNRDQKSYLSVKDSKRRTKTEHQRAKLRSFVQNSQIKADKSQERNATQPNEASKPKPAYFNHVIELVQRANFQQPKSIRFVNNQRQYFRSPQRNKRSQSTNQFSKQQQSLIRRNVTKKQLTANKSLKQDKTKNTIVNEQKVNRLKSFFFNTVDHQRDNIESNHSEQKKCEVKLKNMLQKSNRKKKRLQELFKPKYMDQLNIEKTINANKIYQIEAIDSARTIQNPSITHETINKLVSFQSLKKGKHKKNQG